MDIQPLLDSSFSCPTSHPEWQNELLTRLDEVFGEQMQRRSSKDFPVGAALINRSAEAST
jgi:hypothetical protein